MNAAEQLDLFRLPPAPAREKQRHLLLGGRLVPYVLRQGKRRRLSLTVDERGLTVGAPRQATLAEIESFARVHAAWLLGKLDDYAARPVPRRIAIRDGARLPLLGAEVTVRIEHGANRIRWQEETLVLAARPDADLDALGRRALQRRALDHFTGRAVDYAGRMGRALPRIALSSARTRWGSCSAASGLRFNWRLIHLPGHLVDYVVAHELAHLAQMNHSPRFWAEVERVYPDWRAARDELKRRGREIPLI